MHRHPVGRRHLRSGDDEVLDAVRQGCGRGGAGERDAVSSAAHHRDDEGVVRQVGGGTHLAVGREETREAGLRHQLGGDLAGRDGVVDGAVPVDPQFVVEFRDPVRTHGVPFRRGRARVVEHLAQSQHDPAVRFRLTIGGQRFVQFPVRSERVTVDDHEVGPERQERSRDDGGAHTDDPLRGDVQPTRHIRAVGSALGVCGRRLRDRGLGDGVVRALRVGERALCLGGVLFLLRGLRDAGDQQPVPSVGKGELGGVARTGHEQPRHRPAGVGGQAGGQGLGDREVASDVSQPDGVVRVEHHSQCVRVRVFAHRSSRGSAGQTRYVLPVRSQITLGSGCETRVRRP